MRLEYDTTRVAFIMAIGSDKWPFCQHARILWRESLGRNRIKIVPPGVASKSPMCVGMPTPLACISSSRKALSCILCACERSLMLGGGCSCARNVVAEGGGTLALIAHRACKLAGGVNEIASSAALRYRQLAAHFSRPDFYGVNRACSRNRKLINDQRLSREAWLARLLAVGCQRASNSVADLRLTTIWRLQHRAAMPGE